MCIRDSAYTGFYDGVVFHRVIPGFMIQGGDPTGTGQGNGPRQLKAEFTDAKHVRGVVSAARLGHDVNSASCQFFIVHNTSSHLDGSYSAFGKVVSGMDAVDRIAAAPQDPRTNRPRSPQTILKAAVILAPAEDAGEQPDEQGADQGE